MHSVFGIGFGRGNPRLRLLRIGGLVLLMAAGAIFHHHGRGYGAVRGLYYVIIVALLVAAFMRRRGGRRWPTFGAHTVSPSGEPFDRDLASGTSAAGSWPAPPLGGAVPSPEDEPDLADGPGPWRSAPPGN